MSFCLCPHEHMRAVKERGNGVALESFRAVTQNCLARVGSGVQGKASRMRGFTEPPRKCWICI